MELLVLRFSTQKDSTNGLLFEVNDLGLNFLCYTLEDEHRVLEKRVGFIINTRNDLLVFIKEW